MRLGDLDALKDKLVQDYAYAAATMVDEAPTVVAIPVTHAELKHLINDTIAYIWGLEERGADKPQFGYDSRKALLEKLKQFERENFPELECGCSG